MSYKYVHGPVSVWACFSCHDLDSRPGYAVKTGACYECHVEQKEEWSTKKHTHDPVKEGNCSICHNPHASNYPFNLVKHTWDLCVGCHTDSGTGMHIIADMFSREGHPTRDRPDPARTGKELTCSSCHNPHASDFPRLWAFGVESAFDLCQKCHEKQGPVVQDHGSGVSTAQ
jgi:predicted CXXCH cytochrome family protein